MLEELFKKPIKYDCYIASGWFSKGQLRDLEMIKRILTKQNVKFYSPKDEFVIPTDATPDTIQNCVTDNMEAIESSRFVIVNTRKKDMGAIWESCYAYCKKKPIIFYFNSTKPFNIMLLATASYICRKPKELKVAVQRAMKNDFTNKEPFTGKIQ